MEKGGFGLIDFEDGSRSVLHDRLKSDIPRTVQAAGRSRVKAVPPSALFEMAI